MPIRKCYKPETEYREITPDDDPKTLPWDWPLFGPWDLNFRQVTLDQPMEDLAIRLMGSNRVRLTSLGISKLHRVGLYRHWQAGCVKFEVGSREVVKPIVDEGEVVGEVRDTEEETFVSPTPELEVWWRQVAVQSAATTQPAAADTGGTARQEMDVAPREESVSDRLQRLEKTLDAIRSDPRYDGTVLGTGGFIDEQDRTLAAIRHLWGLRFPTIPFAYPAVQSWLASQGITPLQARRMPLSEVEEMLTEPCPGVTVGPSEATDSDGPADVKDRAGRKPTSSKKSTVKGEARDKLVGALSEHHKYQNGGCLNLEPIGNNELARRADVAKSSAKKFFDEQFHGHGSYKVVCRDPGRLAESLKVLNGAFAPLELYGRNPPGEVADDADE